MLYNPYQPQFVLPQVAQQEQPQAQQIQYVNGLESAKQYQLPPNSSVILMDANEAIFYTKTTDASGYGVVKTYTFSESEQVAPQDEIKQIKAELNEVKNELKQLREDLGGYESNSK
jgi:dihydroxyacetone kinase-like predicted kinase